MALPEHNPDEKVKGGGWGTFIVIIAIAVGLLIAIKLLMEW